MAPHSNEQQDDSEAPLLNGKKNPRKTGLAAVDFSTLTWNKKDKLLIAVTLFTTFGDAVEIYLPGNYALKLCCFVIIRIGFEIKLQF